MLATVVWLGSLSALSVIFLPAARQALDPTTFANLLETIQKRLDPLGWFSVVVLVASGMLQMSANPNYGGLLAVSGPWAAAILVKHVIFLLMVAISAYITWGLLPALRRAAFKLALGGDTDSLDVLQKREALLIRINLTLGVIVLALTAIARAS